jgi:deoxyribonuclease-1
VKDFIFGVIVFGLILVWLLTLPSPPNSTPKANPTVIEEPVAKERNFGLAKRRLSQMYAEDRTTFYCSCKYDQNNKIDLASCGYEIRKNSARAQRLEWEHIVPASYFGNNLQCWREGGRKACSDHSNTFANFEGDMHNLVPEVGELNGDRSNKIHAISGRPNSDYGRCDFRITKSVAEPHNGIKGDVARIWLYMSDKYKMYLTDEMRATFMQWSAQDPVDDKERWRNRRIKEIQGDSNPYIEP